MKRAAETPQEIYVKRLEEYQPDAAEEWAKKYLVPIVVAAVVLTILQVVPTIFQFLY